MLRKHPWLTEEMLQAAIARSRSWSDALRELGYCVSGSNWKTLKKYATLWEIPTDHFDPWAASLKNLLGPRRPLSEILVEGSTYSRSNLKRRLYQEGIKQPVCEFCGQGETWRGKHMSLILDHANGVRDDNRIENLRILCPNCAATLDTHCGRATSGGPPPLRNCERCDALFRAKSRRQRFCSRDCALKAPRGRGIPRPERRKVVRPPYEQLLREIEASSYVAVGRKYAVSDNAVRKWVLWYERQGEREARQRGEQSGVQDGGT